ncbi:DsbA family protein [Patescibacteria group bacterium]|nr:DsbA family protein [Patescibacteria group bacterium]
MPNLSTETKVFIAIIAGTLILIGGVAFLSGQGNSSSGSTAAAQVVDTSILVRPDSHFLGPENAKVTIVEFSDFECPACQAAQPAVAQMLDTYKNSSVRFVYREFPLPSHQYAFLAAETAEAAGLQGKFWEMHDALFAAFESSPDYAFDKDKAIGLAQSLGLDTAKFAADLDSDAIRQKVLNDQADGNKVGIDATPTFFVNGTKFTGGQSIDQFKQEIDFRLK